MEQVDLISEFLEEWRTTEISPCYEVSSFGRVRNKETKHVMSYVINNASYKLVHLCLGCKDSMYLIHRLVAQAFCPNPNGYKEVDHIDSNKMNNFSTNLCWTTRRGNMGKPDVGEKLGKSKPRYFYQCDKDTHEVIRRYNNIKEVRAAGFDPVSVNNVIRGRYKSHKGYWWKAVDKIMAWDLPRERKKETDQTKKETDQK